MFRAKRSKFLSALASQRVLNVGNSSAGLATLVTELLAVNTALIVVRAMSGPARADIEVHIDWLDKRLARLDAELEHLISNNPVWKDLSELLCSAPGIGPVVSATAGDSDWRVD